MKSKKYTKLKKVEILIVEDSPTQAVKLQHILEQNNYDVSVAQNGVEALIILKKYKPTLIITDIVMPEMDGFEFCKNVKTDENLKDIPVILLTALSGAEDIIRGLESGAHNFVTKPYSEEYLLSRIDNILANRDMRLRSSSDLGLWIVFSGQQHLITSDRLQILDLLISTYEVAVQKNSELESANEELSKLNEENKKLISELQEALDKVKLLSGFLPICMHCKKVRDDEGYWKQVEDYVTTHSEAKFSHGICPECIEKYYPDLEIE